jgi:hypothetical protein
MAPAGLTVVIVREDLKGTPLLPPHHAGLQGMGITFDVQHSSLQPIYIFKLVLEGLRDEIGGGKDEGI